MTDYLTTKQSPETETLYRKARGARIECERLDLQIEATVKRALAICAAILASACGQIEIGATTTDASAPIDAGTDIAASGPVPESLASYDCTVTPIADAYVIALTSGEYYCTSTQRPGCPAYQDADYIVYGCIGSHLDRANATDARDAP